VAKGIPSLVVAAASFDDVVALTGFSVAIGSAIPSDQSIILTYMHAPIEVFGALILGAIAGSLIGCTVMWNKHWKRLTIILAVGMCLMFFAVHFHYNSMGALGSLVTGVVAAMCWSEAKMGSLSLEPNSHYKHEVEVRYYF
jgi:Kef-type K+ transport system membrane component KefB